MKKIFLSLTKCKQIKTVVCQAALRQPGGDPRGFLVLSSPLCSIIAETSRVFATLSGKIYLFVLIFLALPKVAQAQGETSFAHSSPHGVFIYLGNEFPHDFDYKINRKIAGENNYREIATVQSPADEAQLVENINTYNALIPHVPPLEVDDSQRLWEYANTHANIDSLLVANGAVTFLSLGIAFLDTAVQQGVNYRYKVEKIQGSAVLTRQETAPVTYAAIPDFPETSFFSYNYDSDLSMRLRWTLLDRTGVNGYNIYRRDNLQGNFEQVDISMQYTMNVDTTFIIFQDSTVERYQVYEYFLRPYDYYGNLGTPTDTVQQNSFSDYDFPYLKSFDAIGLENRQMKVSWDFEQKPFIRSIKIMRSMNFDSGFVQIAEVPPTDTVYIDLVPVAMENYYYRLILNGPNEVSIPTMATAGLYQETEAPKPPTNISSEPTETGVNLRWEDLQNNVYGFYVYRMNGFSEELEQISPLILPDTSRQYVYADTSEVLKGNQYYSYAVKTVNDSYLLSAFSDTVSVRPAIPTAIDTPLGFRTRKDGKTVYLFWNDMQSTYPDLQGYTVYRQRSDETEYREISDLLTANHYQDTTIEEGYVYAYTVQAVDGYGAVSELSYPAQVAFYLSLPVPPSGIKVHPAEEGINISWGEVRQPALAEYYLYRYEPGKEAVRVAKIPKDQSRYLDQQVQSGKLYFYYLTSVNDTRMEGDRGKSVSIRY